jgi:hypothetical protein
MKDNNKNEEKTKFLYVLKFKTAVYCFILFFLLSNKKTYQILDIIFSNVFRLEIINEQNEPTIIATLIMGLIFSIIIFIL